MCVHIDLSLKKGRLPLHLSIFPTLLGHPVYFKVSTIVRYDDYMVNAFSITKQKEK